MHVALVIERFDPVGGGAERSTAQIARELMGRGHRVTLLTLWAPPDGLDEYEIRRMNEKRKVRTRHLKSFAPWVGRQLAEGGFDSSLSVTTVVPAAVVQPRSGTIVETLERNVAMRRSGFAQWRKRMEIRVSPKHQMLLRLERRTMLDPRVKRFLAVSSYVTDQLTRHYGINPAMIEVLPNAAEMPRVSAEQRLEWRAKVRAGFNVSDRSVVYLFAAHNAKLKGIVPLLHAAKRLRDGGLDFVLMLAGQGEYGAQALAESLGIRDRVRMVGATGQMAAMFCAADVTVHPTFYDPSSKVVIESLMMGVPVISTSFNGSSEFIAGEEFVRGRVLKDPADVESLAGAMRELADAGERERCRGQMGGLADQLSMRRHVERLEAVLQEVSGRALAGSR
jgi:UDP-glucose:(heptosyl)LPS alpha-1,3-glucosyltransferase